MANSEFQLIEQYFAERGVTRRDVNVSIGDDCALLAVPANNQLAVTTDTLVSGVHFLPDMPAYALAQRALAANLSDLAAMGADPAWFTLALTLPEYDAAWLAEFSRGLFELAEYFNIQLVGGDTTRGPLAITITAHGQVPVDKALLRNGAKPGDLIYASGTLGDAGLGLDILLGKQQAVGSTRDYLIERHQRPTPRVWLGQALRGIASSAIDLSDGLASDLRHILKASHCRAEIDLDRLPYSEALEVLLAPAERPRYALAGGEDFELLFTVPAAAKGQLKSVLAHSKVPVTRIGRVLAGDVSIEYVKEGEPVTLALKGWDHFA